MRTLFIISITLLTTLGFSQQQQYSFTLEQAVEFALDSSYTAINSRREIAKSLKKKWETTATGLPQINGVADYQNMIKQPVTLIPGEIAGGEPGTFLPVTFGTKQQMSLTATLTQLIFDGSYLVGLKASKVFVEYSENTNEKNLLQVREGVINAYGGVLVAQEGIRILKSNLENITSNLNETKAMYENGFVEAEDVEQLQITTAQITNDLKNAKRLEGISKQMLNLSLGIEIEAEVNLEDDLKSLAEQSIGILLQEQQFNFENNVDYRIAKNLTRQRELELQLEKSKALPRISGFVNYGTSAFDNDFVFFDSETSWYQSSVFGLSMEVPIFSSLQRSAKTQQAKISLDQAKTDFKHAKQQIRLELDRAESNFEYAIENYRTAEENLKLAQGIENKNTIKFKEGISSSFELRQAQTQLYTAQQEYINSMKTVIDTKVALETVINSPDLLNNNTDQN
ncbi:outer membrane efflux protein [Galbibacter marinus]|uniref:Outer membrane efflux protein n=1 Tax=Galbibacter marinus TaxID=555500 RepID=K2QPL7_9FLAO|nr:TolC family protein [Galbibacter marinus]EKF56892.1 outer membrane efflux protein [Galbibacter marinus]